MRRSAPPRRSSSGLAAAAALALVVAGVAVLALRRRPAPVDPPPPPTAPPAVAPYALTDDDRAAMIQAARTLAAYGDPSTDGPAAPVATFRRLAGLVAEGRIGPKWPDFSRDVAFAAFATGNASAIDLGPFEEAASGARGRMVAALRDLVSAIDSADVARAMTAHASWTAAQRAWDQARPVRGPR